MRPRPHELSEADKLREAYFVALGRAALDRRVHATFGAEARKGLWSGNALARHALVLAKRHLRLDGAWRCRCPDRIRQLRAAHEHDVARA